MAETRTKLMRRDVESLVREILRQKLSGLREPPVERLKSYVSDAPHPLVVNVLGSA